MSRPPTAAALRRPTGAAAERVPIDPETGRPGVAALRRDGAAEALRVGAPAEGPAAGRRLAVEALLRLWGEPAGREGVTLRLLPDERVAAEPEGWEVE